MIETALAIFLLNTRIFVAQIMVKIIGSRFVFGRIGIALRRSLRQFAVVKFEENLARSNVVDITFFEISTILSLFCEIISFASAILQQSSSKVVVLSVIIGTVLIVLPYVPLFISTSVEFNERYTCRFY